MRLVWTGTGLGVESDGAWGRGSGSRFLTSKPYGLADGREDDYVVPLDYLGFESYSLLPLRSGSSSRRSPAYVEFANLKASSWWPEQFRVGVGRFVERHGPLGRPSLISHPGDEGTLDSLLEQREGVYSDEWGDFTVHPLDGETALFEFVRASGSVGESLSEWAYEVRQLAQCLEVWKSVAQQFNSPKGEAELQRVINEAIQGDSSWTYSGGEAHRLYGGPLDLCQGGQYDQAAFVFIANSISAAVQGQIDACVVHRVGVDLGFEVQLTPRNLLAAMWWDFGCSVLAGTQYGICPRCGGCFDIPPKSRNKRFCSASCRAQAHQRKNTELTTIAWAASGSGKKGRT